MGARFSQVGILKPADALEMQKMAASDTLKNSLKNYIKAYNALPLDKRSRTNIQNLLNTRGVNNISYKNRLGTSIAGVVSASRRANAAATSAVIGVKPQMPAAVSVNNATRKLNELNTYMSSINGNANRYSGRNSGNNRRINASRPGGPKYANFFTRLNARQLPNGGPRNYERPPLVNISNWARQPVTRSTAPGNYELR